MTTNKYEAVIVFDADLDDEALKGQLDRVKEIVASHSGEIEQVDHWGRKQFAYPINKKQYGIYVLLLITGDNSLVTDLRRQLRINDLVVRSLIVKKDKFAPDMRPEAREEQYPPRSGRGPRREGRGERGDRGDREGGERRRGGRFRDEDDRDEAGDAV